MTGAEKTPMYRGKRYNQPAREKEKVNKRKNWYSKGGYETVMFVDSTPGSKLAKEYRHILDSCGLNIRQRSVLQLLARYATPFQRFPAKRETRSTKLYAKVAASFTSAKHQEA